MIKIQLAMESNVKTIKLSSENFFYTIQGEGKYCGYPSVFIRTSGCNLRCAWRNPDGTITLCDTPHTSFKAEKYKFDLEQLITKVTSFGVKHIVITGGEPFLQNELEYLCQALLKKNHFITIETNGTIYRNLGDVFLSISTKLSSSEASDKYKKLQQDNRIKLDVLTKLISDHDYQLKFVVNSQEDINEIKKLEETLRLYTNTNVNNKIWVMPQGISEEQIQGKMKSLFEICKVNGWKYSDRLHIRAYGQQRGV